jgi:hypothetical protein
LLIIKNRGKTRGTSAEEIFAYHPFSDNNISHFVNQMVQPNDFQKSSMPHPSMPRCRALTPC